MGKRHLAAIPDHISANKTHIILIWLQYEAYHSCPWSCDSRSDTVCEQMTTFDSLWIRLLSSPVVIHLRKHIFSHYKRKRLFKKNENDSKMKAILVQPWKIMHMDKRTYVLPLWVSVTRLCDGQRSNQIKHLRGRGLLYPPPLGGTVEKNSNKKTGRGHLVPHESSFPSLLSTLRRWKIDTPVTTSCLMFLLTCSHCM